MIKLCHLKLAQKWRPGLFWLYKLVILATLKNIDFQFVLPIVCINIDGQTNLQVNQTQIGHFIHFEGL